MKYIPVLYPYLTAVVDIGLHQLSNLEKNVLNFLDDSFSICQNKKITNCKVNTKKLKVNAFFLHLLLIVIPIPHPFLDLHIPFFIICKPRLVLINLFCKLLDIKSTSL